MPEIAAIGSAQTEAERVFRSLLSAWTKSNLPATLCFISNDVVHALNLDGKIAPFAASTTGKNELRKKLRLALDLFATGACVIDQFYVDDSVVHARIKMILIHKATGERLQTNFRTTASVRGGLIERIEETHDARYLEAFARLIAISNKGAEL